MKTRKTFFQVLAGILCFVMFVSVLPMTAYADYNKDFQSETHTVFKHTEQTLAPGVTNYTNYAYSSDGKQMVYYVTTADLNRDDVVAQVAYKGMQNDEYGMDKLSNMVACANGKYADPTNPQYISEYYTVVSACNGDGYNMTTGEPSGVFIMGGVIKKDWDIKSNPVFLAILADGSAVIANTQAEWDACKEAGIQEAIDIFGNNLVWDGKDVTESASGSYATDRHSRTMVGITADGKLVVAVLDGRQEPFSCGGTMHELAQIMLEAGCVRAFNLDGGGSTTFIAKNEGADETTIINRPSDGSERSISNGIIIASTAVPSNVFDHVTMSVRDEYLTSGTTTQFTAIGVSPAGTSAVIPEEVTYTAENGTIDGNVYTAGAVGTDTITAFWNGNVVGTVTVNVVIPDSIVFDNSTFTIPYGKTAELGITAKKGLNVVKTKPADYTITLENADAGVLNGLALTAPSESSLITETTVTAVLKADTAKTANANVAFGKGSEVLVNFEGFTIPGSWDIVTGYPQYGPGGTDAFNKGESNGQNEKGTIEMVNASAGKVHGGDNALAINVDMSQLYETGYHLLNFKFGSDAFIIPANATAFGFWMYVPEDTEGMYARCLVDTTGDGSADYTPEFLPIGLAPTYTEAGWHYYSFDMSNYTARDAKFFCIQIYITDRDNSSYNYYFKNQYSVDAKFTLYLDDITVDYSSVVDDREAPVFSSVKYADGAMSDAVELNSQTTHDSVISFTAEVAENIAKNNYTGLNTATAKAYIDGKEVSSVYSAGKIAVQDATLADGVHTVTFEIADNMGNVAKISRKITVAANSGLTYVNLVPQAPDANKILIGSIQWYDLKTNAIEDINSITTVLNLNSVSNWELNGMIVANGFTAEYVINEVTNDATVTITRTGFNGQTGEGVIVSIPVRTWVSTITNDKGYETSTPAALWTRKIIWPKDIKISADYGVVALADGTETTFSSARYQTVTELYGNYAALNANGDYANKTSWHVHTVTAVADKAATCTEDGYTGRTFCEVCNSVVNWGTVVPATGHTYEVVDGVLKCTVCGELFNGVWTDGLTYVDGVPSEGWIGDSYYQDGAKLTGVQTVDGFYYDFGEDGVCPEKVKYTGIVSTDEGTYYSKIGELSSGWINTSGDTFIYCSPVTLKAVDGEFSVGGHVYTFENEILVNGAWYQTDAGMKYYWAGHSVHDKWVVVDGKDYYFNTSSIMLTGFARVRYSTTTTKCYLFEDTGALIKLNGIYKAADDTVYYLEDGECLYAGLVQDGEGNYYYINSTKTAIKDSSYYVSKTNDLLPAGNYTFGADGKMVIIPPKNGFVTETNGDIRYYENDVPVYAGLVQDADGNYYYVNSAKKAIKDTTYYVTKTNGILPAGNYTFDADGKMVIIPPKNGFVTETNGDIRYYENDVPVYAGLVQDADGNYYYVNSAKKAIKDTAYYVTKTNGLMSAGLYTFGSDGIMIVK